MWNLQNMLVAVISFMYGDESNYLLFFLLILKGTTGMENTSSRTKRELAVQSHAFNYKNTVFR